MTGGHIFLVGFMGAGKSTVARLVAERLGMPCIDLDASIERHATQSVSEIFAVQGEDAFRQLETQALSALADLAPAVVACGGGVVVRAENRSAMKRMGVVVYLSVTAEEAVARVGDATTRPLLSGPSGVLAATALLQAREALYRAGADFVVDTGGRSAEQVAATVIETLEART